MRAANRRVALRTGLVIAVVLVVGLALTAVLRRMLREDEPLLPPAAPPIAMSFAPLPSPIELQSAPATQSVAPIRAGSTEPAKPQSQAGRRPRTAGATAADLSIGRTVGLEVSGRPGALVRHRDTSARVEAVGRDGGATDRADTRFIVRVGNGDRACVSLEAASAPGHFLRHQNFVVKLAAFEPSQLFAADTTFCAVPRSGGTAISLRSINYPDRFVTAEGADLTLARVRPDDATAFRVRPPL